MKLFRVVVALIAVIALSGCRSRVVKVTLTNASTQPLFTIIVDYPGATFGKDSLRPGETYHYVIKPSDTGALKIQFTNAQGVGRNYSGPVLQKGQEGSLEIKLTQDTASAQLALM